MTEIEGRADIVVRAALDLASERSRIQGITEEPALDEGAFGIEIFHGEVNVVTGRMVGKTPQGISLEV